MDYNISGFEITNEVFPKFLLFIKSTGTVRTIYIITQSVLSTILSLHKEMLWETLISRCGKKNPVTDLTIGSDFQSMPLLVCYIQMTWKLQHHKT